MIRIEVITGPMFSGKTEEMIRRINNALYAEKKVLVLKPKTDNRSDMKSVVSRRKNGNQKIFEPFQTVNAIAISKKEEMSKAIQKFEPDTIAIDEAQFFDE